MAKVLIVDDSPELLKLVGNVLTQAGHRVVCHERSADAVQILDHTPFDVAIVDYQMPAPNGLELLRQLREIQPLCQRILMSGELELPVLIDAVNSGEVARVLEKPFRTSALCGFVDEMLTASERFTTALLGFREEDRSRQRQQLQDCLAGDAIRLALQPIVDTERDIVVAFEALIRSSHPTLSHPQDILQTAERLDMLDELALVVADRASSWLQQLPEAFRLFINVHPQELVSLEALRERVSQLQPWASRIVFEVTERTYLLDLDLWSDAIQLMRQRGFALAVDDLGAGYNSLSVLAELQPQYIKVDMSIVRGVDSSSRKQRLIELLCRFADATETSLIAEGVETLAESRALRQCGAGLQQGFLFARPSVEMPDLKRWSRRPPSESDPEARSVHSTGI